MWVNSACKPNQSWLRTFQFGDVKPARVPGGVTVKVGTKVVHPTHALVVHKGLYYCNSCGYFGHAKLQHLGKACVGLSASNAVQRVLSLKRGVLPRGLQAWPNETVCSGLPVASISL